MGGSDRPHPPDDLARVGGNRAGVVEWANEAFGRLTGIPLADTIDKPVTRFLERAGVELEVVDFVAQHFFEGRPCRIEFPFERPDGRRIDVLLEVEAIRDAEGEIDRFEAVARERRDERADRDAHATRAETPDARARAETTTNSMRQPRTAGLDLAAEVGRIVEWSTRHDLTRANGSSGDGGAGGTRVPRLELAFEAGLPRVAVDRAALRGLVDELLSAAREAIVESGDAWGTITLTVARADANRRYRSRAHAVPAFPEAIARGPRVVLEVHDTGHAVASEERARRLDRIRERARAMGADVHLDATPGCGNQVLVLFEPAFDRERRSPFPER